jgi:hypothetical protein
MPGTNAPFPLATVQILQVIDPVTNKPAGAPLAAGATAKAGQYVQACGAVNATLCRARCRLANVLHITNTVINEPASVSWIVLLRRCS